MLAGGEVSKLGEQKITQRLICLSKRFAVYHELPVMTPDDVKRFDVILTLLQQHKVIKFR